MNYVKPTKTLNSSEYDYIVSIGNKCPIAMILKKLNIYRESFVHIQKKFIQIIEIH